MPSTRAIAAIGKQAWFALMNRKSRTAACRSPEQTRPRLLKEYRAPAVAACSHAAAGSTHHARMRSDHEPPLPGGPRFGQPGRPTREWSGRLAQTRGQDRQDYVQHGRGRPSAGETPANTVDVFLASAAPLARDSGCPPNRVNPSSVKWGCCNSTSDSTYQEELLRSIRNPNPPRTEKVDPQHEVGIVQA